jgi:hypothetical protein
LPIFKGGQGRIGIVSRMGFLTDYKMSPRFHGNA